MDEPVPVTVRLFDLDRNTVRLLRIPFSYFLMPVFFFALSQADRINWLQTALCFVALHLFAYPASNGYNSYMDRDESSIGGLEHPPKPSKKLFYVTLIFDITALSIALAVDRYFFIGLSAYILASRAYSYKGIRLKKFPVTGFLTVTFFQGAVSFWMIYSGISGSPLPFNYTALSVLAACSFLIGGVYPLTQVYQIEADRSSGDISISSKLGIKGTFIFSAVMFLCSDGLLFNYFNSVNSVGHFVLFQAFLLPVLIYFTYWFLKVLKDEKQASFKNTMRMNRIASTSLNVCFIVLLILNHTQ